MSVTTAVYLKYLKDFFSPCPTTELVLLIKTDISENSKKERRENENVYAA